MLASEPNPLRGIALKLCSVIAFTMMAALIKAAGRVPPGEIVFFRSFFAIFPILAYLMATGTLIGAFKASDPFGHIWRGFIGVCAMAFGFYAITRLPLPEVTALGFASPLFVVLLSAVFLKEQVRFYRWSAVLVGLLGVIVISWPRLTVFGEALSTEETYGALATICGAFLAAIAMLIVRRLVRTEQTQTIVLFFSISASLFALLTLPFGWVALDANQVLFLVTAGMIGGIAQIFLTESYRHAEASVLAPFEYSAILLAILIGYFVFSETPTAYTIIGSAIVVGAGIYIIWRERKLGLERGAAKAAAPPQV
ncbi:MAG: DMT family transporter [Notoacmeibacter sp.]